MSKSTVHQFKVTLQDVRPTIWRRIQVPSSYSFWDLHVAIQNSMGWKDYHLHEFEVLNPKKRYSQRIGSEEEGCTCGRKAKIEGYFSMDNKTAFYQYDFGNCWDHKIVLEKILPIDPKKTYPLCLDGKRRCPPEDSGGSWRYEKLLKILKNPLHTDYKDMIEWIGDKNFDPEAFNMEDVVFDDSKEHVDISVSSKDYSPL